MMTLDQARQIQKEKEKKSISFFVSLTIIWAITFFLIFRFTNLLSTSKFFLILPTITLIAIIHYTHILKFIYPKEFSGSIVRITIFSTRDNAVKGAGWYMPSMIQSQKMAKIISKDAKGKSIRKTFRNGDVVSKLSEGDEITILRYIDEQPFLIKSRKSK